MVKQTPNRNQRTKGFKLKQGFKILILMALCIWLLYQLKNSNGEKKAYDESSSTKIFDMLKAGHEINFFGRKALEPWIKKPYELIDDTEDSKGEEIEDLIDEEDKDENDDEDDMPKEIEDEDLLEDDMPKEIEDEDLLEDGGHNEGEKNTQGKSENHYKENGASRVAMKGTQSIGTEFELGNLKKNVRGRGTN